MKKQILKFALIALLVLSVTLSATLMHLFYSDYTLLQLFQSPDWQKILITFIVMTLIIFVGLGFLFVKLGKKHNLFSSKENLASSDFADLREFDGFTGNDGVIVGKTFRLSEKKSFEHILCLGPTGSGKSAAYFIPNLLALPDHASVVVSDPKGELFEKTARHALNRGKKVLVFSPFKTSTMKYNPLSLCRNVSEIRELSQNLLANGNAAIEDMTGTKAGGAEWTNMATPLLAAFLIFVKDLDPPKNTISYAVNLIIENDIETLKFLMEDAEPAAQKQFNVFMQSAESEKTASSIKTVLATNLQLFMDPMIEEVTNLNEIDPLMLRKHPTHLHVIVPEHKSAFMSPLMGPFYTQMFSHLVEDGRGCPVYFMLDELANIGVIPGLDKYLATIRSRKMSVTVGIQSTNQLKQRYGEASETILDNLKTKFALPGLAYQSAEYISKLVGFKEVSTTSTSYGKDSVSHSVSKQKRELLTPDEVRRLEDETMVIISDNRNPFIDNQFRYYKDKDMLRLTNMEIDLDDYVESLRDNLNKEEK